MNLADMLRHRPAHAVLAEIWRRVSPPQDPWMWTANTTLLPVYIPYGRTHR
ncbi:hypothetical protein ABGB07_02100 [Micromonosporaceae bacterium B7E4]